MPARRKQSKAEDKNWEDSGIGGTRVFLKVGVR